MTIQISRPAAATSDDGFLRIGQEYEVLGRSLRSPLPAEVLLSVGDLTTATQPTAGEALVGLDLKPSEAPTGVALVPGDRVGILVDPAASQAPYPAPEPMAAATVWQVSLGQSGDTNVTVIIPSYLAVVLAS